MSRFSVARHKRAGETFARAHHGEDFDDDNINGPLNKKMRFDVRNPSALAPGADGDEDEENEDLAADVIGRTGRVAKRGAVNIDGYDSDSENENFETRAHEREKSKKQDVDFADEMDNYNNITMNELKDDDEMDIFKDSEDNDGDEKIKRRKKGGVKGKEVRFIDEDGIEGQDETSKTTSKIRLGDQDSTDDEEYTELVIQEQAVDQEVGAGGLKKHAPKIDAFNMRQEQEEGAFDEAGNFVRKSVDPDAVHDLWLEGLNKSDMKKAAEAHERREVKLRQQQRQNDSIPTSDLFKTLILHLDKGETPLEALARQGRSQSKAKKVPKWKQKKKNISNMAMDVDEENREEDLMQVKIKDAINAITDAADKLLKRDNQDIYSTERELLIREYEAETGENWADPPPAEEDAAKFSLKSSKMWEFRWIDGGDQSAVQGPYDCVTMKAWQNAGYFSSGVEFRPAGVEGGWSRVANFV